MKFLLFQIYSPLVSWGEIAVGGERQSSRHPSKSAVIGMIAAALGIKRDEEERLIKLADSLGFAVQLYSGGSVLKDFHTVQVPKKENKVNHYSRRSELMADKVGTILSRREYRCDALSVIAVYIKKNSSDLTLESIEKALREPVFHLYFGRKSAAPALPLAPLQVEGDTLKDVFGQYCPKFVSPVKDSEPEWLKKAFNQYPSETVMDDNITYFWEEGIESGIPLLQTAERYDMPLSRKRWQFCSRFEHMGMLTREEVSCVSD